MKKSLILCLALVVVCTACLFTACDFATPGVKLDKTELTLTVGETYTLKSVVTPVGTPGIGAKWSSSNEEVVTVDDEGKLTAVAVGEATITLTVTTFSATCNVTVVSNRVVDTWNGSQATEEEIANAFDQDTNTYNITTVSQLAWVANQVNTNADSFAGKTVKLANDLDFNNVEWTPIGNVVSYPSYTFKGTFDGNDCIISNLKVNQANAGIYATAGLFGSAYEATFTNLTIDGANITSEHYIGVIVGYTSNGITVTNCTVKNATLVSAPVYRETNTTQSKYDNGDKVGAIAGYAVNPTITGCTVENVTITAYRHVGGIAGYVSGTVTVENNTVKNTTVTQDYTNAYKTDAEVEGLVGKFVGNPAGATIGTNIDENVTVIVNKNVSVEE